ncbi:hypothetical protein AXG93_2619s1150 [Marchantia polymorpha subsp. ruderalis]|uniref:Uncharacterized protein n=1 Tax=Marchantia polymorpha subsp. ruderalis TaxID=1480154 RepID=A0A176VM10_MARPO|nr:hypothetical protein AXG93_2619s1150 [Marchantia polymorpha subsp. ruderalis]
MILDFDGTLVAAGAGLGEKDGQLMGRAKVLTKKLSVATPKEVLESTAWNPVPVQRKRGRPQKGAKEELPVEEK